jgi:hypothetical protein
MCALTRAEVRHAHLAYRLLLSSLAFGERIHTHTHTTHTHTHTHTAANALSQPIIYIYIYIYILYRVCVYISYILCNI